MTTVLLIRHGRTKANAEGVLAGWTPGINLDEKGQDQARALAKRLHALVTAAAPDLWPKTWYGMPAYAKEGKVVCFFKSAGKFDSRYATFGFEEAANLDEGAMWPTSFALKKLTPADEKKIGALVKKAVS